MMSCPYPQVDSIRLGGPNARLRLSSNVKSANEDGMYRTLELPIRL